MKKIFIFLILIFSALNFSTIFASENNQTINYLIKFINSKNYDLENIVQKYDLEKDSKIKQYINDYKNLKSFLEKLKKSSNTKQNKIYIANTVKKLKSLNEEIKSYLKQKIIENKQKTKKYSIIYSKKLKPIIEKIDWIIQKIALKLVNKDNYSKKDKQIINILYLIKQRLNNLNSITTKTFYSRKQLNNYIISNFSQIKNHFRQIRQIAK